jgi:hypothetical protein
MDPRNESWELKRMVAECAQPLGPREAAEGEEAEGEVLCDAVAERLVELGVERRRAVGLAEGLREVLARGAGKAAGEASGAWAEQLVRGMLVGVVLSPRPKLEARVCLMALGVRWADDETLRRIGGDAGLTAEGVRKMVLEKKRAYRVGETVFNKTARARAVYQITNGGGVTL